MSERCDWTSKWTSGWPSTFVWILDYSGPQWIWKWRGMNGEWITMRENHWEMINYEYEGEWIGMNKCERQWMEMNYCEWEFMEYDSFAGWCKVDCIILHQVKKNSYWKNDKSTMIITHQIRDRVDSDVDRYVVFFHFRCLYICIVQWKVLFLLLNCFVLKSELIAHGR